MFLGILYFKLYVLCAAPIMTMISNFTIFSVFRILIFNFFLTNVTDFGIFMWFLLLLITSFISFWDYLFSLCALLRLQKTFKKLDHAIFTPAYIMLVFYAFKWQYRRHWKYWWNMFAYFCCRSIFRIIFTSINLFYYKFIINNK